jgi:hypothetical protein
MTVRIQETPATTFFTFEGVSAHILPVAIVPGSARAEEVEIGDTHRAPAMSVAVTAAAEPAQSPDAIDQ